MAGTVSIELGYRWSKMRTQRASFWELPGISFQLRQQPAPFALGWAVTGAVTVGGGVT
jgi:hypothetical protein